MKKTTEITKNGNTKRTSEPKTANSKKAARRVENAEADGETTDRLPTTLEELKATKGGFVAHLFLIGKDKDAIAKDLAAAFKLAEPQAVKITRRITGRVRLYARVFDLVGTRASAPSSPVAQKPAATPVEASESNDTLRENMRKWLADRYENGEPLKFQDFVGCMAEMGFDRKAVLALKAEMNGSWKEMKAAK